jgi:NADH:ubiquinone oxidoreductase subunit K
MLLATLTTHVNTALHLLLTAELIWITLYALVLIVGFTYDSLNLLSLTFFFLIFSAVEFSVGLVLLLLQHLMLRTLNLDVGGNNSFKFTRGFDVLPKTNFHLFKL